MKKYIFIVLGIFVLIGAAWAGTFYWKNLRGSGPAFFPAPSDITQSIPTGTKAPNTTGMPLKVPEGFSISIFAKNLVNPRVLTHDPQGTILASITSEGKVVALPDKNGDSVADETVTVISGLRKPHGIASRCLSGTCQLFVAESNQVAVYTYDTATMKATNKKKLLDLPDGGGHFTRTLLLLPMPNDAGLDFDKQRMLISIGSSCNVCREKDPRRASVMVMNTDGSNVKEFATGLRNSVFMTIHPVTGNIWATEMGRDLLGDDIPPDEVNILEEDNPSTGLGVKNYGWPNCYGKNIHDADFDKNTYIRNPCMEPFEMPSYIDIPAHSAPLGLGFIPEEGWPENMWYNMLVAYHGSWNRTQPTGYKIVRYKMNAQGTVQGVEDFITGWLTPDGAIGRPVDILVQSGGHAERDFRNEKGTLSVPSDSRAERGGKAYISDDKAGVVYLLTNNTNGQ